MNASNESRRIRRYLISPDIFVMMTSGIFEVEKNAIPEDAIRVGAAYDTASDYFVVFVIHESFDEVPYGAQPPMGDAPLITKVQ